MSQNYTITSDVIKQQNAAWDQSQKDKFINKAKSPISYAELIAWCVNEDRQNHKMAKFDYKIKCFISDGTYQLHKAIETVFGTVTARGREQPSGEGDLATLDVQLADGTRVKVPFGTISLDALGEGSEIHIDYDYHSHELIVTGRCQVRYQCMFDAIIEETKKNLAEHSIYKNQALELTNVNEPKIMELSSYANAFMVLSEVTEQQLKPLKARILYPERCIQRGIPLKFGALMEGGYGTGKTLLAFKLAYEAIHNGWAFIYLKDPTKLAEAINMAHTIDRSGYGCIIFTEDIDQVTRGNRDAAMQTILNTLDGGDTKNMNVITIFTTNHIELIEPTFLRGKRIGTVIKMRELDAKTAEVFLRESFKDYDLEDDLKDVCAYIAKSKIVPAFMAEIVEKVKTSLALDNSNRVTTVAIRASVESYLSQVQLAQTKDMTNTPAETLYSIFTKMLSDGPVGEKIRNMARAMKDNWDEEFPVK